MKGSDHDDEISVKRIEARTTETSCPKNCITTIIKRLPVSKVLENIAIETLGNRLKKEKRENIEKN